MIFSKKKKKNKKSQPEISLIAALSEDRVIGNKGRIPWHIKEDFKRFKTKTLGHVIIMGRKTFASILNFYQKDQEPLSKRKIIIVTRNKDYKVDFPNCYVVNAVDKALKLAEKLEKKEIFISGGAQIYQQTISLADKLYLTIVKGNFKGDAFFPEYKNKGFEKIKEEEKESEGYKYSFLELEKI